MWGGREYFHTPGSKGVIPLLVIKFKRVSRYIQNVSCKTWSENATLRPRHNWKDNIKMYQEEAGFCAIYIVLKLDVSYSSYRPVAGSCEHGFESSGSTKGREFINWLCTCYFLKKATGPQSYLKVKIFKRMLRYIHIMTTNRIQNSSTELGALNVKKGVILANCSVRFRIQQ